MSFGTLLYRYFFFGWMFRDVTRGNLLERSAAWRHNQSQAHWLLTYMRRWLWCSWIATRNGMMAIRSRRAASTCHSCREISPPLSADGSTVG